MSSWFTVTHEIEYTISVDVFAKIQTWDVILHLLSHLFTTTKHFVRLFWLHNQWIVYKKNNFISVNLEFDKGDSLSLTAFQRKKLFVWIFN